MLIVAKLKIRSRATLPDRSGEFKRDWAFSSVRNCGSHRNRKTCWRKNTQKGTYVRPVIVYRDKTKAFLKKCGAIGRRPSRIHGRAPGGSKVRPWRDGRRDRRPRRRRLVGKCRD